MLGQVVRPEERPAAADLDDGDPGEVERQHPEPLERQVEAASAAATLNTPSWPTTIDHGSSAAAVAVAGDLRAGRPVAGPAPRGEPRRAVARAPAGRAAWTSRSASPPGAQASSGSRRQAASTSPQRASISSRCRPSHSPWPISSEARRRAGSGSRRAERAPVGHRAGRSPPRSWPRGRAGSGRSRAAGRAGTGSAGRRVRAGEPLRRPARAWRGPIGESGVSAWPWKRPSTIARRFAVADEDEGRVEPVRDQAERVASAAQRSLPSRIVQRSRTASWRADRVGDGRRDVVVERQDHQRVLARRRAGEVHRADVHVGLAEHLADPPDRARPVVVAGDEHHVASAPCRASSRRAGRAAARRRRPSRRPSSSRRRTRPTA